MITLCAALSSDGPWFAQAGLAVILMVLLLAGVLLLARGAWDLISRSSAFPPRGA